MNNKNHRIFNEFTQSVEISNDVAFRFPSMEYRVCTPYICDTLHSYIEIYACITTHQFNRLVMEREKRELNFTYVFIVITETVNFSTFII